MFFPSLFSTNTRSGGWLSSLLSQVPTSNAGVLVTPETALTYIAVYACVKLLAESVAQLPCTLYRREGDGRVKADDHPLYDLMRFAPNSWQTAFQYNEFQQGALGLRGNSYSLVDRTGRGEVSAIIPLNPAHVSLRIASDRKPVYDLSNGESGIPASRIHHIAAFSTNGYTGLSPIQAGRNGIGLALATEEHTAKVFANGTTASGWISRPKESKPISDVKALDQIREDWKRKYTGLANSGEIAILQEGMEFHGLSMSNEDAQLIASREFSIGEVARIYNIPPHMIQLLTNATFSNIEHQGLQFVIYTLLPWIKRHEAAMMRDLLTASERRTHYLEFNFSGLLRGDMQTRFTAYAQARQWGWMSVNDIRRLENMPPIQGGDVYLQPLNMVDAAHASDLVKQELTQLQRDKNVTD